MLTYGGAPYREDGTRNTHGKPNENAIRIEDAIPAIIDKEVFELVQKRMADNKRQQGGRPPAKREYPLKGKVFCGECKSAMTISTSRKEYYYYRCTGKKRLHICEASPINADYLENRVAEALRMILGKPEETSGLIRILRDQAEQLQAGSVSRLENLIQQEREVTVKLNNAVEAVLNGLASQTIKDRIQELEQQKAAIARDMRQLKAAVDASAIPEQRLRDILDIIVSSTDEDPTMLLSIVYRVEVSHDKITIWTMLDSDPNGTIDETEEGVTITNGVPFGVPIVFVTDAFIRITVAR